MDENGQFITAFLTLPVADAIVGTEVTGVIAFCKEELQKKVANLNGRSQSFRVAELQIPEKGCITHSVGSFMIPNTTKAVIKGCHEVQNFINQ